MRYIDSGNRDRSQALGTWLQTELTPDVTELRWQSGFFTADSLSPLVPTLGRLAQTGQVVRAVIGSNEGGTLASEVGLLAGFLGLPRAGAQLGVVHYAGAYYHAKTFHLRRGDGSQAAYVGSANLTAPGVGALHVEAGLLLDTRTGELPALLDEIAAAVDAWFLGARDGIELINDPADVARLQAEGVLAAAPPPPLPGGAGGAGGAPRRPRLHPLFPLPRLGGGGGQGLGGAPPIAPRPGGGVIITPQPRYPAYVILAPGATTPTRGAAAVTGTPLPGGNTGIITRLSRDSARPWEERGGTTNFSLPIPTMETLRFGRLASGSHRPRAELDMEVRYLHAGGELRAATGETNIMIYGYEPGERSNPDRRLGIPEGVVPELLPRIRGLQAAIPAPADPLILEWPTPARPSFRLTLLERGSPLAQQAEAILAGARAQGTAVGRSSCWLPPEIFPSW